MIVDFFPDFLPLFHTVFYFLFYCYCEFTIITPAVHKTQQGFDPVRSLELIFTVYMQRNLRIDRSENVPNKQRNNYWLQITDEMCNGVFAQQ